MTRSVDAISQSPFPAISHADVLAFYGRYSAALSDNRIEDWPLFFTESCRYEVVSRTNYERALPLGTMRYLTRGALVDRVEAIGNTLVYAPRAISHLVGSVLIIERLTGVIACRSSLAVYQTLADGDTELLLTGRSFDDLCAEGNGSLLFAKRTVVYDSDRIPGALVYPV